MDNQWKWCVLYPKLVWEIWSEFKHNAKYHNLNIIILFYFWQSLSVNPYPSLNIFFFFVLQHMWMSEYIFSNPTEKVYPKPFESLHPFRYFISKTSARIYIHVFQRCATSQIHSLNQSSNLHLPSISQSYPANGSGPRVVMWPKCGTLVTWSTSGYIWEEILTPVFCQTMILGVRSEWPWSLSQ